MALEQSDYALTDIVFGIFWKKKLYSDLHCIWMLPGISKYHQHYEGISFHIWFIFKMVKYNYEEYKVTQKHHLQ